MKKYETPFCRVKEIDLETSFLTGASAGGFPVDPSNPFSSSTNGLMGEDDYE
jgi:hypothetical protein